MCATASSKHFVGCARSYLHAQQIWLITNKSMNSYCVVREHCSLFSHDGWALWWVEVAMLPDYDKCPHYIVLLRAEHIYNIQAP